MANILDDKKKITEKLEKIYKHTDLNLELQNLKKERKTISTQIAKKIGIHTLPYLFIACSCFAFQKHSVEKFKNEINTIKKETVNSQSTTDVNIEMKNSDIALLNNELLFYGPLVENADGSGYRHVSIYDASSINSTVILNGIINNDVISEESLGDFTSEGTAYYAEISDDMNKDSYPEAIIYYSGENGEINFENLSTSSKVINGNFWTYFFVLSGMYTVLHAFIQKSKHYGQTSENIEHLLEVFKELNLDITDLNEEIIEVENLMDEVVLQRK